MKLYALHCKNGAVAIFGNGQTIELSDLLFTLPKGALDIPARPPGFITELQLIPADGAPSRDLLKAVCDKLMEVDLGLHSQFIRGFGWRVAEEGEHSETDSDIVIQSSEPLECHWTYVFGWRAGCGRFSLSSETRNLKVCPGCDKPIRYLPPNELITTSTEGADRG